ncbi:MAG: type III pantothenate kinase, partial [Methanothrix sp.]|nr:type III pantothenate kinase [Methanothrix sp.]
MIWAIDIGNTRTVSGLLSGTEVLRHDSEPTDGLKTRAGATRWAKRLFRHGEVLGLVVSSVVPPADPYVRSALKSVFGTLPLFVRIGPGLDLPVLYKKPAEVGADRLMDSLAAREIYGAPVV